MNNINRYLMASALVVSTLVAPGVSASAAESDSKIESSFKNTYVYKTYLKDDEVSISSDNGVVTLAGTVSEESHKALAQDTAENLTGVSRVENKLMTKRQVKAESIDAGISRNVKLTLLFHRNVSYRNTNVAVKDGVVTLTGEASSSAEKELVTEYVKDINGVKGVSNEMTVAQSSAPAVQTVGEAIDDASITAQIKTVLMNHHSTSATKTGVKTRDGAVTITGIAKNDAEKSLVTKLITDIRGVVSVDNQMTVE